jgi:IS605 OrfB family transposase
MVCNAIQAVADAYKSLKALKGISPNKPVKKLNFTPTSVPFDKRTYSIKQDVVSLFTTEKRIHVSFTCGEYQRKLLNSGMPKEATLVLRKGIWYFNLVLEFPDQIPSNSHEILGVDVGENNLAATSSGKIFGGKRLRYERDQYLAERKRLQSNGSKASIRKLQSISGREQKHVKHINHETSKGIVQEALRIGAGEIRMEDLTNIRDSIKAGRRIRTRLHRWAFRQLQSFVEYKAKATGLRVTYVNPAYTSQTCSVCGNKGIREKHSFSCTCGAKRHSDVNASVNIARFAEPIGTARGVVDRPKFVHQNPSGVMKSTHL